VNPCDTLEDAVAEGLPLDAAMRAHASGCDRCRALTDTDHALGQMVNHDPIEPAEPLPAALREAIRADAAPVQPFSFVARSAAPVVLSAVLAVLALRFMPRADLHHRPFAPFAAGVATLFALVLGGAYGLFHRGPRGIGISVEARAGYLLAALLLAEGAVALASDAVEASVVLSGHDVIPGIVHCASFGTFVAIVAGVGFFFAARRTVLTAPTIAGAVAGGAAGLTGTLVLHLACPIASLTHAMTAHVVPALLGALVGALLGRRVLAV
jgi:hypothetical protein